MDDSNGKKKLPHGGVTAGIAVFCTMVMFGMGGVGTAGVSTTLTATSGVIAGAISADNSDVCEEASDKTSSKDSDSDSVAVNGNVKSWVDKYGQTAFDAGKKYGIPYEIILAQGVYESTWTANAGPIQTEFNNLHGIQAWKGCNKSGKQVNGAYWCAFDDTKDSFVGYAKFITENSNYKEALKYPGDPQKFIEAVVAGGYSATDVDKYASTVMGIEEQFAKYIKDNNLFPPSSQVDFDTKPSKDDDTDSSTSSNSSKSSDDTDKTEQCETESDCSDDKMEKAINWAVGIANDDSHGYSQAKRDNGTNYDCGSLVYYALVHAGIAGETKHAPDSAHFGDALKKLGFTELKFTGEKDLKRGDILVKPSSHVDLYIGDGKEVAAHHASPKGIEDDDPRDTTGKEISVNKFSFSQAEYVYRYSSSSCQANSNGVTVGKLTPPLIMQADGKHVDLGAMGIPAKDDHYQVYQCTWWAYERRKNIGRPVTTTMGNAGWWNDTARALGWQVNALPAVGDVICFEPGVHGSSKAYGHVGVVEQVNDDGSILISQSGRKVMSVVTETISKKQIADMGAGVSFIH